MPTSAVIDALHQFICAPGKQCEMITAELSQINQVAAVLRQHLRLNSRQCHSSCCPSHTANLVIVEGRVVVLLGWGVDWR